MALLSVRNVTKIYGTRVKVRAVNDLSLQLEDGEMLAIMGASGSGKSTLLNLISGILPLTSGQIYIDGQNISAYSEDESARFRRKKLGFVFQGYNLVETLTIRENIMLPLMFQKIAPENMRKEAEDWARRLGIQAVLDHRPCEVSGGQAQRAAIARALIHHPELLLADEPTGNLDYASAEEVMRLFSGLNREEQIPELIVTHDARTASFCQRVVFIQDGKIFNEMYREGSRLHFYDEILNILKFMGGEK